MTDTVVTYPRFTVVYLDRDANEREATLRIRSDILADDRAADAWRQLVGNLMAVSEIVRVTPA